MGSVPGVPCQFAGAQVLLGFLLGWLWDKVLFLFCSSPPCILILLFLLIPGLMNCNFSVAGEVSCFTKAEVALKEAVVSELSWRREGSWTRCRPGLPLWREHFCSPGRCLERAGQDWLFGRERLLLTTNGWLLWCAGLASAPCKHQPVVDGTGGGGQNRHKARARVLKTLETFSVSYLRCLLFLNDGSLS